jgi:hypothetical protein
MVAFVLVWRSHLCSSLPVLFCVIQIFSLLWQIPEQNNLREEELIFVSGFSHHGGEGGAEHSSSHHGSQEAERVMIPTFGAFSFPPLTYGKVLPTSRAGLALLVNSLWKYLNRHTSNLIKLTTETDHHTLSHTHIHQWGQVSYYSLHKSYTGSPGWPEPPNWYSHQDDQGSGLLSTHCEKSIVTWDRNEINIFLSMMHPVLF